MSDLIKNDKQINSKTLASLQNEEATEWILIEAEKLGELQDLANATLLTIASLGWYHRIVHIHKIYKQYLIQCKEISDRYKLIQQKFVDKLSDIK